jgi:hypothetical protein
MLLFYYLPLLFRFDRGVVHDVLVGYIVYHYSLRFDGGVVQVVLLTLSTITV